MPLIEGWVCLQSPAGRSDRPPGLAPQDRRGGPDSRCREVRAQVCSGWACPVIRIGDPVDHIDKFLSCYARPSGAAAGIPPRRS
eukprot:10280456-Lingulodinium_polyedra.AAC.1